MWTFVSAEVHYYLNKLKTYLAFMNFVIFFSFTDSFSIYILSM